MSIQSFDDKRTAAIFAGDAVKGVGADLYERARVKLAQLDAATQLSDLASPGADLKQLKKERHGWQMRVNKQFRIRFNVLKKEPLDVADVWFGDPH
jgi:proteic killer suppression protein